MTEILQKIDYQLPVFLQECINFSDLIHMVQLNDLKDQKFNHISIIGKFSEILTQQQDNIFQMNKVIKNKVTSLFLDKKIDKNYLRPNHSINNYDYDVLTNNEEVLYGMLKCNDFYILVNTLDEKLKYNVYAYAKDKSNHELDCNYQCLVFIGKIVNVSPYKIEDVEIYEKMNNLRLCDKFKNFLTTKPKIFGINNDNNRKLFYINLFNDSNNIKNKFTRSEDKFDLEEFRPRLNKIWEKQLIDDNYKHDEDDQYLQLMKELEDAKNNFLNGFIHIGTILDKSNMHNQKGIDNQIKIYFLINSDDENQGTLWIYDLSEDPSGKTNDYIDYLPVESMTKIGCVLK
jgi:hypothetical protein